MANETPRRFLRRNEYSMDQELATVQAERRGDSLPRFESPAYRKYRSDVLREGGLDAEADELEADELVPLADQSVGEHFDRISGPR